VISVTFPSGPVVITRHRLLDAFGNEVHFVQVQAPHREFVVEGRSVVQVVPAVWPDPSTTPAWDRVSNPIRPTGDQAFAQGYRHASPYIPLLDGCLELARPSFPPGRPVLEAALNLNHRIHDEFQYSPHSTSVATPLTEVLRIRRGVCQDFAHLMLSCLRSLRIPARYVSGYLETLPPPGKPRLVGADASHAWVQVWVDDWGWVELDPTNDCLTASRHIRLAVGRDFGDVSPLRGILLGGGTQAVQVSVDVERLT
jgi:transglutaminase-like putative cysteine protease